MPLYRIYTMTRDGRINGPSANIMVEDDTAAIERAVSMRDGLDLEIWQGTRRVTVIKAKQE